MAYTKNNWQTGDTVTAEKLNHMEDGIEANDGYWIPVEFSGGAFSVPDNKVAEVVSNLQTPDAFIKGVKLTNGTLFSGYRVNPDAFVCPFTSEMASELGVEGTAKLVVSTIPIPGEVGEVSVEFVPDTFIVTLTPTAQDFSGTMDKTVAEINAAYEAGRKIVFKVMYDQVGGYIEIPASVRHGSGAQNEGFFANVCFNDTIIVATTGVNPPSDRTTYSTIIYPLTPMS